MATNPVWGSLSSSTFEKGGWEGARRQGFGRRKRSLGGRGGDGVEGRRGERGVLGREEGCL